MPLEHKSAMAAENADAALRADFHISDAAPIVTTPISRLMGDDIIRAERQLLRLRQLSFIH